MKFESMYWNNWRLKHKDRWNEYHREYMRKWRAKAEAEKLDQMDERQKKLYLLARRTA